MRVILLVLFILFCVVPVVLRAEDHAGEELAEFARARPEAGVILRDSPEIGEFLRMAFQGASTSVPLDWNSNEPQGNAYAENTPSEDGASILIRVSSRLSPVDQIAALVYECRNARNEEQFARYIREAYLGALTRQDFIHEILRLEHGTMKETRAFLAPLHPFRDLDPSATELYRKMLGTPDGFAEFIDYLHQLKRPEYDVFAMYSKFYDYLTVTPQKRKTEMDAKASGETGAASNPPPPGSAPAPGKGKRTDSS